MHNRTKMKIAAAFALWAVFTLLLFGTGIVNRQKVWANPPLSWEAGERYRSETAAYGVKSSGPYLDLAAGTYRLKWQIEGDGTNEIRLTSSNDARIVPDVLTIKPGEWEGEAVFQLLDPAHSFSIGVTFASGTKMACHSLRLYSPEYTDYAFLLSGLLLAAALLFALFSTGRLSREGLALFAVLVIAVLVAGAPSLQDDTTGGWDVQFHAARLANLADALRSGQFPGRVGGFSYNGYGAATSVFYPDLFLYPWAWMLLCGCSMSFALNSLVLCTGFAAAGLCFRAARKLGASAEGAAASAVLYTLCAYRLADAYGGSMLLGELIAMAFVPPFIASLWKTLFEDDGCWKELGLAAAAVFYAHVLTTLLCALLAAGFFAVSLPQHIRTRRGYGKLLCAFLLAALLCLRRIVPLLQLYVAGVSTANMQFGFVQSAVSLKRLLESSGLLGAGLLVFTAASVLTAARETEKKLLRRDRLFLLAGGLTALAATQLFPWGHVVKLLGEGVSVLQFPWRFLLLTSALWALAGGRGAETCFPGRAALAALIISVLAAAPLLTDVTGGERGVRFGEGANPYMVYPEYQIEGTDVNDTRSREPVLTGDLTLTDYHKDGTNVSAQVSSAEGGTMTLPLFAFPGYEARLNGQRTDWERGNNNRLKVTVPPGFQGELRVRYAGFALWKALDILSVLTLAAVILHGLRDKRKGAAYA